MDHQPTKSAMQRAWRTKDGPRELFGGRLVNRKRLAGPDLLNCPASTISRYIRKGMPVIRVGQSLLFDPDACCSWFRAQQRRAVHLVKGG
jgi:hypothetical protein